ncbi:MAG: hypothetical protein ACE5LL_03670 [Alphaproteobacteria bacterium]
MSPLVLLAPLAFAAVLWYGLYLFNRRARWFRPGELVFWDAVLLVALYLLWLRWF